MLSRLNTRPARSPVNASTPPLRAAPHDSGPVWVASSLPYDSFIHYTSPVLPAHKEDSYGVYFIFKSMEQGRTFRIGVPKYPTADPNYRILAHQRSRFTHYYFYIRDEVLGPIIVRVASFFPFHATYWLNGHSFMEQELKRKQIGFCKNDNAFLAVDDVAQLQTAADRLSTTVVTR